MRSIRPLNKRPYRADGSAHGPRVQSNKPTTLEAVQALWSDDEANTYDDILAELRKLRPKGGGTYAGVLIVYDADGLPSLGEGGEYLAYFKIGATNGKAFPSEANGPPIHIKRKDIAVLRHVQVSKPLGPRHGVAQAPMRNHENPIEKYEQFVGRTVRRSKVETAEAFAERLRTGAEKQAAVDLSDLEPTIITPVRAEPLAVTVKGASEMCSLGRATLYRAIDAGLLVARKHDSRTLILVEELHAFLKNLPTSK